MQTPLRLRQDPLRRHGKIIVPLQVIPYRRDLTLGINLGTRFMYSRY